MSTDYDVIVLGGGSPGEHCIGQWQFTHVGKYQGEVVAANILGEPRTAN